MPKILIVDDEPNIVTLIAFTLSVKETISLQLLT